MAISIRVYPELSPRIVEVLEPTTDVTVQEIVDAIREWEDTTVGMNYPYLIDAAGKESLGGGVTVGITATLQNAQLMFTGRTTPLDNGSGRTCDLTDSLGEHLYVDDADFVTSGIYPGCTVFNSTTGDMASVTEVTDLNNLQTFPISGGAGGGWTSGDSYSVYPNVQCSITGGNLVAVDSVGSSLSSVIQSPNVQVVRSSSSSATLSELDAIQYASYGGGVSLDIVNGISGTEYPAGNKEFPSNNITDAMAIAATKGFDVLFVDESMTGANKINSGTDLSNFTIYGKSRTSTTLEIDTSATTTNCVFKNCTIYGTLDGFTTIMDSDVGQINYLNGELHNCGLFGTIYLDGNEEATIVNCYTIDQDSPPTIDMGGSGQDLAMPNYSGLVTITNLASATEEVGIGLNAGRVVATSSVTAGTVIVSGIGSLTETDGTHIQTGTWNGGVVVFNEAISKHSIGEAVWDASTADHEVDGTMGKRFKNIYTFILKLLN